MDGDRRRSSLPLSSHCSFAVGVAVRVGVRTRCAWSMRRGASDARCVTIVSWTCRALLQQGVEEALPLLCGRLSVRCQVRWTLTAFALVENDVAAGDNLATLQVQQPVCFLSGLIAKKYALTCFLA
jgi:hypothetical protein